MNLMDFFKGREGKGLSMSRLLMFGSFVVTSAIMAYLTLQGKMSEGYFAMYIGAWSTSYLGGKAIDSRATPPA